MSDTLNIKDEDIRKKDEFNNRLLAEIDSQKKKLSAANNKINYTFKDQIAGSTYF